jgi:translation initiation factor 2D
MVMVSLYIIPNHWVSLLRLQEDDVSAASATSEERRGTGMLTAAEARKILDTYIIQESLVPPEKPQLVQLDGPLTKILYQNENVIPELQARKDLVKQFMSKLLPAYALVKMPGNRIVKLAKGIPPKVEIEVSMRQSKKFVTRVRGLENYAIDPAYFSKDVSRRLACSAAVETTASNGRPALRKNHVELVFQGNIALEIEALLVDESLSDHGGIKGSTYSVPKQVLEVNLRKGVPGRKGTKK